MLVWLQNFIRSLFGPKPQPIPTPVPEEPAPLKPLPVIPADARPSDNGNVKICGPVTPLLGIDVSHDQPLIGWPEVKMSGRRFAFVKATEGVTVSDSEFPVNWRVGRAFLTMSAYHFFRARDTGEAQAEHYLQALVKCGKLTVNDLPPMLDWEVLDGQTPEVNIERAQVWLDLVEKATGRVPILYTDTDCWNQLGNPQQFHRYPLFIANPGTHCPHVPPPWNNWVFHQVSWEASVPGVRVLCDADRFNGTLKQFQTFIRTGQLPWQSPP